jgi:hypothetical protein
MVACIQYNEGVYQRNRRGQDEPPELLALQSASFERIVTGTDQNDPEDPKYEALPV